MEDQIRKKFGNQIKVKRKELNLTQDELAEKLNISSTYLRSVEKGQSTITWIKWLMICQELNVDPNEFIPWLDSLQLQ